MAQKKGPVLKNQTSKLSGVYTIKWDKVRLIARFGIEHPSSVVGDRRGLTSSPGLKCYSERQLLYKAILLIYYSHY